MSDKRLTPSLQKTTMLAVIVNGVQILALLTFLLYVLFIDLSGEARLYLRWIAIIGTLMATWGAVIDIIDALKARRSLQTITALKLTNEQMDALNLKLRAQRHDFLNHVQVVYSLMEMQEYDEANAYLERIYTELRSVSRVMRTKMAAFNALLQVKAAACDERGVELKLDVRSTLEGVPVPPWELCCVIGNLLDNAMDACQTVASPVIGINVSEDLHGYTFTVYNNGEPIPADMLERIFEPGVSTKGENHGMGLSIARQTLGEHGGQIVCESAKGRTAFTVTLPRAAGL